MLAHSTGLDMLHHALADMLTHPTGPDMLARLAAADMLTKPAGQDMPACYAHPDMLVHLTFQACKVMCSHQLLRET